MADVVNDNLEGQNIISEDVATDKIAKHLLRLDEEGMKGLPNYNFIRLFMTYLKTDKIHPEINFQNAVSMLSAIALKRTYAKTKDMYGAVFPRPLYVNNFGIVIAGTGEGKSISHEEAKAIITEVMGHSIFADASAPETLKKSLADAMITTHIKKGDDEDGDNDSLQVKEVKMPKSEYPRGWKVFWHGEFGGTIANMQKPYMASLKQEFCNYYSCADDSKNNSGDKQGSTVRYILNDIYLGVNAATTIEGITPLTIDDIARGFWTRFDVMYARFDITQPDPIDVPNDDDTIDIFARADAAKKNTTLESQNIKRSGIVAYAKILNEILHKTNLEVEFDDRAYALIQNHEIQMNKLCNGNEYLKMLRSRQMENIYKLAILIALGDIPYYVLSQQDFSGAEDIKICSRFKDVADLDALFERAANFDIKQMQARVLSRLIVTPEHAKFAMKMHDRIYWQNMIATSDIIMSGSDTRNDMTKIIRTMQSAPLVSKQDILNDLIKLRDNIKPGKQETDAAISYYSGVIDDIMHMVDDVKINKLARSDVITATKITGERLDPVIRTLTECGSVLEYKFLAPKAKKPTTLYLYFQNFKKVQLPEENYSNYVGNGTYSAGVILSPAQW